jgi:hypothetical protein
MQNDLITFGRPTVNEDPYDKVQRMTRTRAKTGVSLILDSGIVLVITVSVCFKCIVPELDQEILAERRRAADDDRYVREPEPFDGLNDTEYLDDLMSSFMEFDD